MLNKKQMQEIFLFKFKMGCKAEQITHNINKTFGPGTAKEHIVQLWFRKFFKEDKSLEDEDSGRPSGVDNDQLKGSLKPILLQLHDKLPKNSTSTILWSFGIWSKLERWKSSKSQWLMSWPHIKSIIIKVSSSLILRNNNEPFLNWIVMRDEKWVLYDN